MVRILVCFLIVGILAGRSESFENSYVRVTCDLPDVSMEQTERGVEIYAPGFSETETASITITALNGWHLIKPCGSGCSIEMKGGDWKEIEVVKYPEDAASGRIWFHNYCIRSSEDGKKVFTVPVGKFVTVSAFQNGKRRESDWIVNSERKEETASIVFNRSFWQFWKWFIPSMETPIPGTYFIFAHPTEMERLWDEGKMVVVGACFDRDGRHLYGYDDFTSWIAHDSEKESDYYGAKNGYCSLPYLSVPVGKTGYTFLKLTPDVLLEDETPVNLSSGSNGVTVSPAYAFASLGVSVTAGTSLRESTVSANCDGYNLASVQIVPLKQKYREIIFVLVNGASNRVSNIASINAIFRECTIEFSVADTISFTWAGAPTNHLWTANDRAQLARAFENRTKSSDVSDNNLRKHYVYIIPGFDSVKLSIAGWGSQPGNRVWLYDYVTSPTILAHELGHNCSLDDEYIFVPNGESIAAEDRDNVMNMGTGDLASRHFRYEQWIQANKSDEK